jgi:transposase-like protein
MNLAGDGAVLGTWVCTGGEGAKHWMACLAGFRKRGMADAEWSTRPKRSNR